MKKTWTLSFSFSMIIKVTIGDIYRHNNILLVDIEMLQSVWNIKKNYRRNERLYECKKD